MIFFQLKLLVNKQIYENPNDFADFFSLKNEKCGVIFQRILSRSVFVKYSLTISC